MNKKERVEPSSALFEVPSKALAYRFFLSLTLFALGMFSLCLQQARINIFILALINMVFCAGVFMRVASKDLSAGKITWALWVSLAVVSGVVYSGVGTLAKVSWVRPSGDLYLYTMLLTCFALWSARKPVVEKERAHVFTRKIDDFLPKSARLMQDEHTRAIFAGEVVEGDILLVKAGERFPADGFICKGKTVVDEQLITGNILPAEKSLDSAIFAGTLNKGASVEIEVTAPLKHSAVMEILNALKTAEIAHSEERNVLDQFSRYALTVILLISLGIYVVMTVLMQASWLHYAGALLCAWTLLCSFGVVFAEVFPTMFMCQGAKKIGVEIQNVHALARIAKTDVFFFDKTGTLTYGRLRVSGIFPAGKSTEKTLTEAVCAAEQSADGPFAQAVKRLAHRKGIKNKTLQQCSVFAGLGVEVSYDKKHVRAGSIPWFKELGIVLPAEVEKTQEAVICVAVGDKFAGYLTLADDLRAGAAETIDFLKRKGKDIMLVSGDTEQSVAAVADRVGIEKRNYFILPKTKAEIVTNLRSLGRKVVMVGDGFNDIMALLKADAGMVFFSGKNVYNNWVDIVLKTEELSPIKLLFALHRKHLRIVWQNMALGLVASVIFVLYLLCYAKGTFAGSWRATLGVGLIAVVLIWLNSIRMLHVNDTQK